MKLKISLFFASLGAITVATSTFPAVAEKIPFVYKLLEIEKCTLTEIPVEEVTLQCKMKGTVKVGVPESANPPKNLKDITTSSIKPPFSPMNPVPYDMKGLIKPPPGDGSPGPYDQGASGVEAVTNIGITQVTGGQVVIPPPPSVTRVVLTLECSDKLCKVVQRKVVQR